MGSVRLVARNARTTLVEQWRPVVMPTLALWVMAAAVSTTLLRPFDVLEYQKYAHAALHTPLFHRFPLEYPAPALVLFLLPLLLPLTYPWAFAVLVGIALVVLVTSYEGTGLPGWDTRAVGRLIIYLALGSVMVLAGRYDIFATLAAFLALRAATRDRWSTAWTWSSIGFVLKLFPAAFWPVFLIAEWRRHGRIPVRRLWWMAGSVAVLAGLPALLNHAAAFNVLHYYLHRPAEDGSLASGLSVLLDWHGANLGRHVSQPQRREWDHRWTLGRVRAGGRRSLPVGVEATGAGAPAPRGGLPGDADVRNARFEGALGAVPHVADANVGALPAPGHLAARRGGKPGDLPVRGVGGRARISAWSCLRRQPDTHLLRPGRPHRGGHHRIAPQRAHLDRAHTRTRRRGADGLTVVPVCVRGTSVRQGLRTGSWLVAVML